LTKSDLINAVHLNSGSELSKKLVGELIDSTFGNVSKAVRKNRRFSYPDFGTFTVKKRKARMGRNPQTGEKIKIKASKTVGFKPAPSLKSSL
jgi:DNA-binding protein HU-beta